MRTHPSTTDPATVSVAVGRRALLQAALATVASGAIIGFVAGCGRDNEPTGDGLPPVVSAADAIVALGVRFRELRPDFDDIDRLQTSLALSDESLAGANSDTWLATTFANAVRADFADQKVDVIDGWIMSITELRAAALLSLLR